MEKMIEQNQEDFFMMNRGEAKKKNAVKLKETLRFPSEILYLFAGSDSKPASVSKVNAIHMFESSP
jgi:ureidoglycolate hydrolase